MANPSRSISIMPRLFSILFRIVLGLWILTGPWDGQG